MNIEILRNAKNGDVIEGVVPTILAYSGAANEISVEDVSAVVAEVNENLTTFDVTGIPGVARAVFLEEGGVMRLWEIIAMSDPGR